MKNLMLLLLAMVFTNGIYASSIGPKYGRSTTYFEATIYHNNGSIKEGMARIPEGPRKKNIRYKTSADADKTELISDSIQKIAYHIPNGPDLIFVRNHFKILYGEEKKNPEYISKQKVWMVQITKDAIFTAYRAAEKYYISEEGEFHFVSKGGSIHFGSFPNYLKHTSEDILTQIGYGSSFFRPTALTAYMEKYDAEFAKQLRPTVLVEWGGSFEDYYVEIINHMKDKDIETSENKS